MFPAAMPKITFGEDFFKQISVLESDIRHLSYRLNDFHDPLETALEFVIIPSIRTNFAVGGRPKWKPLSPITVRARGGLEGPILYRSGDLYNAATDRSTWTVTNDMLIMTEIVSKVQYAIYHQLGTRNMAQREFVLYQPQDIEFIVAIFEKWLDFLIEEEWGL